MGSGPLKRASVFLVGKLWGTYFCNLAFVLSSFAAVMTFGVAPLFLTIFLPTLLWPLVVSQDEGLCVSLMYTCILEEGTFE